MTPLIQRRIAAGLLIAGALVAIVLPFASATLLTIALGGVAFAAGIGQFLRLGSDNHTQSRIFRSLSGLLYVAGSIWILIDPVDSEISLTLFAGVLLLVEGVMELAAGASASGSARGMVIVDGVITTILGTLLVVQWPSDSLWALGTLFGAALMVSALNLLKAPSEPTPES
ncbi:MAG: HdeD family acid-resistance protein [Prochlorococcus sp.]|nr:DUF308 domain-containing protein [Prochlorococcaceae cyanobacterium Fu_MAG_50]